MRQMRGRAAQIVDTEYYPILYSRGTTQSVFCSIEKPLPVN
jgi:hypothetical protein